MMKPPKDFLVDSFEYYEVVGRNDWNEPTYSDPVEIKFCRIDDGAQYTFSTSGRQLLYNGLIFCYQDLTEPMIDFRVEGIAKYNGVEHVINRVIPVKEAFEDRLYAYELEVV